MQELEVWSTHRDMQAQAHGSKRSSVSSVGKVSLSIESNTNKEGPPTSSLCTESSSCGLPEIAALVRHCPSLLHRRLRASAPEFTITLVHWGLSCHCPMGKTITILQCRLFVGCSVSCLSEAAQLHIRLKTHTSNFPGFWNSPRGKHVKTKSNNILLYLW